MFRVYFYQIKVQNTDEILKSIQLHENFIKVTNSMKMFKVYHII